MRLKLSGLFLRESAVASPAFAGYGTAALRPPARRPQLKRDPLGGPAG
jgi:hypothetical protein